ncbi:MAG: DNA polymerase III subunit delta' [Betaproteobacteria bacterium]|nr:DNA polymerase III subunit delta' [Betaproteobacteria bacterium]
MSLHPWNEPVFASVVRRAERLPHALLFHGPRGVGKLALAEHLVRFLLCEAKTGDKPCGRCEACRWLDVGSHPDFRRLEPEALAQQPPPDSEDLPAEAPARKGKPSLEIKVEQVRELADFLNVGSHRAGRRVALVHPAEDMTVAASNALLKALEEPPGGAMFVLVSHRPARLLPTIRSRCVAVPVPIPQAKAALKWLAAQGVKDPERRLAYAGGAPLRALAEAEQGESIDRLLELIRSGSEIIVEDRAELEALAEALQRYAIDQAVIASGAQELFLTRGRRGSASARAWLAYARKMGENRALARHPLAPKLFAAEMLAAMPGRT